MKSRFRAFAAVLLAAAALAGNAGADDRPNILFCIADDWGYPHASAYGDPVVQTPTFDRLAREGALFQNAFVSAPSCTPSRAAILTGQYHWRLGSTANLWSVLPGDLRTYPEELAKAGYFTGHWRKAWGPGTLGKPRTHDPSGPTFKGFGDFLKKRPAGQPFCFWLGASDPHRPYDKGSGAKSGIDLSKIAMPACLPDDEVIRSDVADYYFEVQRFDNDVAEALAELERIGELDNTIVVMTGDHGLPFPRAKSNLYDIGTQVPLAIRWGGKIKPGTVVGDFASLTDLAPTFLAAAGVEGWAEITGVNLLPALREGKPARDHVLVGKERHVPGQENQDPSGYPCRALRNAEFLYIRNYRPELWPNGTPHADKAFIKGRPYADCDAGPSRQFLIDHKDDPKVKPYYDMAFAKRPAEELYSVKDDPGQLKNLAADPEFAEVKAKLAAQLDAELRETKDPRVIGGWEAWDNHPYTGGGGKVAEFWKKAKGAEKK